MDYNKAMTFVLVVDLGSVTAAANQIGRTQQAISLQIQQFQEDLNLSLFDRKGPKLTLTDAGEALYQSIKPSLNNIESAVLKIKADRTQATGVIRIGVWMEQSVNYLPSIIKDFRARWPGVTFKLHIATDHEIESLILDNKLDMGLMVFIQNKAFLKNEQIYLQPLIPVASPNFIKHFFKPKHVSDTLQLPHLDYELDYSAYTRWIKKNDRDILTRAMKKQPIVTVSNNVVLKQLAIQGIGFSFLHQESIVNEIKLKQLVPLFPPSKVQPLSVGVDVVYKRNNALGYIHREFISFLQNQKKSWDAI